MKIVFIMAFCLISKFCLFSQTVYQSSKHYSIKLTNTFEKKENIQGFNIDMSYIDKSKMITFNSVVSKLKKAEIGHSILELLQVPIEDMNIALSESLENSNVIKVGATKIGNIDVVYIHNVYGKFEKLIQIGYNFHYKGNGYSIGVTCKYKDYERYKPTMFSILKSIELLW